MKFNKKRLLFVSLFLVLTIFASSVLAFITAGTKITINVTMGTVKINLDENTEFTENVKAGDIYDINNKVINVGNQPVFIRMKIDAVATSTSGTELPLDEILPDVDTNYWTEVDGWYYYNSVLDANKSSELIFDMSDFTSYALDNTYMGAAANIEFTAQAVQEKNNGTDPVQAFVTVTAE